MAEHWKSTPRYWCKHCSTYVRDTKLERQNHEATGRHQGAVKRSLRELHRGKEAEDREKERARREIERLNGVVAGSGSSSTSSSASRLNNGNGTAAAGGSSSGVLSESERKRQAEQLALMGVSIPQEFRGDLAMAGEWTVTATTIVEERRGDEEDKPGARARGVHKRDRTEEQKEEEKAVGGLFKKPRRWGRDSRTLAGDTDLDTLLSGGLTVKKPEQDAEEEEIKEEIVEEQELPAKTISESPRVKEEAQEEQQPPHVKNVPEVKQEHDTDAGDLPVLIFKKRKPKNVRQK